MSYFKDFKIKSIHMGRFKKGSDLLLSINNFIMEQNIVSGRVEAIGALSKAAVGYYDQIKLEYSTVNINQAVEITSLSGNISIKDGSPFTHCHITVADSKGMVMGGHLMEGCQIYALEFMIFSFEGEPFIRELDQETKLSLWKIE